MTDEHDKPNAAPQEVLDKPSKGTELSVPACAAPAPTPQRINDVHSSMTLQMCMDGADHESQGLRHRPYTQSPTEGCYICALLNINVRLERELAAALASSSPYMERYLSGLLGNEVIRRKEAEAALAELRSFHDAAMKDAYEILGIDGSDGEFRYKWVSLEISKLKQHSYELQKRLDEKDAEIARLRADAERLDWLQSNLTIIRDIGWIAPQNLRTAIDAAKEGE